MSTLRETALEHYPFQSIGQFVNRHNRYSKRERLALKEERGALKEKEIQYNVHVKPMKRFLKFYDKKRRFQDGIHG